MADEGVMVAEIEGAKKRDEAKERFIMAKEMNYITSDWVDRSNNTVI